MKNKKNLQKIHFYRPFKNTMETGMAGKATKNVYLYIKCTNPLPNQQKNAQ